MLYSEHLPYKKQSVLNVALTNFSGGINSYKSESVLPLNYAVKSYNFNFNKGSLSEGLGLSALKTPYISLGVKHTKTFEAPNGVNKIIGAWLFKRYDYIGNVEAPLMVIYGDDNTFYCTNFKLNTGFSAISTIGLNGLPVGINYRLDDKDCMIFCSTDAQGVMYTWDSINAIQTHQNCPAVVSLALHAGRLFATSTGDKKKLYFSDDLDPRNWEISSSDGGYIEISDERGSLNKLIEWNNYLYVIRDYGITRVSAWGTQEDFVVRHLYLSTGKIYANSAVHCGSCILMLCKDGLYMFDGVDTKKVNTGLDKFFEDVDNENAIGAFLDGKYYLACNLNYDDQQAIGCESGEYKNNSLLEYDISTGEINILRGVDISMLLTLQTKEFSRLACCVDTVGQKNILMQVDHSGSVLGVPTQKMWQSPTTDLGYPNNFKVLNEIYISSSASAVLIIKTDKQTYSINIEQADAPKRYRLNIKCNTFSVGLLSSQSKIDIKPPTLKVTIV